MSETQAMASLPACPACGKREWVQHRSGTFGEGRVLAAGGDDTWDADTEIEDETFCCDGCGELAVGDVLDQVERYARDADSS